ncbi:NAD(P)/FAD-dependent oxidoreductase [uncultured Eudoraea sp.]|uniref:NAD(P)/FAD-dependent oxidoreductase n=1 Tax=uncultured Eudoraea sp. TaxID=1035614 RepID=UPI00261DCA7C|nr:NAD(P)/FAD-dependent oxidoreductase [uncultured Eudoraea sp.]
MFDVIIIGGGAAGFYCAIHIAEANPELKVAILERGKQVLSKVKVSGGGRCNVTHAEFEPSSLVKNYPRGEKELLGPFHIYSTLDTIAFFEKRGIHIKTESDGRMFPESNSSQTIINCFLNEIRKYEITLLKSSSVINLLPQKDSKLDEKVAWQVQSVKKTYQAKRIVVATGSSTKIWTLLEQLGHKIVSPVPSLFTFNINDSRISGIPGLSMQARIEILPRQMMGKEVNAKFKSRVNRALNLIEEGPVLITHWGLSGPAVLKLSARAARLLNDYDYRFRVRINWMPDYHKQGLLSLFNEIKQIDPKKTIYKTKAIDIPARLWGKLVVASDIAKDLKWADVSRKQLERLSQFITASEFNVDGKSTFKEEFVTAGGVDLKEVNFKTFESKILPHLYFAGEVLNIDAVTGGFNFQNAWTGAYIASQAIVKSL